MSNKGISIFLTGIFLILVIIPLKSFSQAYNKASAGNITTSDTIDYLPEMYAAAKEYNLMIASSRGLISEIERLIKKGANINSFTEEGVTPLIFAVSNNKAEAVKTLLKHSPRLDEFTIRWETALMIAVKNNYSIIAEALLRAGAEVDFADNLGASPLHYAALYGYTDMTDLLLYYDASIDAKRDDGFTALHTATWAAYPEIADLLIQNNANMEARDNDGDTPFLLAASLGDTLTMELLNKFGVDIFTKNNYNHNALTLAIAYGQNDAVNYLLKKSNRWSNAENIGYDPYKVASKYGRKEIDRILKNNNVPGKTKHSIDQAIISANGRFTPHDYYSGLSISFKEPYYNAGFTLGMDMKLWYTRILREESEDQYFQYYDKGAMIYTGLFKDFKLTNGLNSWNTVFTTSLSAAYTFGNKFRGTMIYPDNNIKIIPGIAFKWTKNPLSVFAGAEYINYPDYYKIGPLWFRMGLSYNYYFDNIRIRPKKIRWN